MTSLKISNFDFSATISNINAQFAPVNRGAKYCFISCCNNFFESTSGMRDIISLKFSKFNFNATVVSSIYAQFAPVKRRLNSALYQAATTFSKILLVCANDVIEIFKV